MAKRKQPGLNPKHKTILNIPITNVRNKNIEGLFILTSVSLLLSSDFKNGIDTSDVTMLNRIYECIS